MADRKKWIDSDYVDHRTNFWGVKIDLEAIYNFFKQWIETGKPPMTKGGRKGQSDYYQYSGIYYAMYIFYPFVWICEKLKRKKDDSSGR
jgi:hypothetical protein